MSFILMIIYSLIIGFVFGFALEKARVFEPGLIIGQMQMRRFTMIKVFFTAIATGMVAIALMNQLSFITISPVSYPYIQSAIGGLLLGVGIVLSGACPGTVIAQIGAGYKDAIFTLIGGLFGAIAFFYLKDHMDFFLSGKGPIYATFDKLFNLPFCLIAFCFALLVTFFMFLLEKKSKWKKDLGKDGTGI